MNELTALLSAELRRFFSRRLVHAMFAFGIALSTLVLVILTVRSDFRTGHQTGSGIVCTSIPSTPDASGGPATIEPQNGELPPGCTFENQFGDIRQDHRLKIGTSYSDTVAGVGSAMVFVAFVIGASFVGAEYGAGSLSTQLIFEPRRHRVVAVKAVAVGIGTAVLSILLLLYIGLLQWIGSQARGVVSGLDGTWFAARAGDIVRVSAAVALAAIAAYAITVVARRTVAAVAGLLVVGWVSAIIGSVASWRWVAKDNPASALFVMALDPRRSPGEDTSHILTIHAAIASSCLWAIGLTLVAAFIFARREVR